MARSSSSTRSNNDIPAPMTYSHWRPRGRRDETHNEYGHRLLLRNLGSNGTRRQPSQPKPVGDNAAARRREFRHPTRSRSEAAPAAPVEPEVAVG